MAMQGNQLKAARQAMGLSQADLAELLGLSRVFIGMMERGDKVIEPRTELAVLYLVDHPERREGGVRASKSAAEKIADGLQDAIAYAGGDTSRGRIAAAASKDKGAAE